MPNQRENAAPGDKKNEQMGAASIYSPAFLPGADVQLFGDCGKPVEICLSQVSQQSAALSDHFEQSTALKHYRACFRAVFGQLVIVW